MTRATPSCATTSNLSLRAKRATVRPTTGNLSFRAKRGICFFPASLLLYALAALLPLPARAQVATGTPPFGSFAGGPDIINLSNLNAHLDIPVVRKPGRGLNFDYDLSYDSAVWYPVGISGSQTWQPVFNWGWRSTTEPSVGYVIAPATVLRTCRNRQGQITGYFFESNHWAYHDPWGIVHSFVGALFYTTGGCTGTNSGFSNTAPDGSGYSITVTGPGQYALYNSAGKNVNAPYGGPVGNGTLTDRNGNQITVNGSGQFFDTLSSTIPTLTVSGSGTPSSPIVFTYIPPDTASSKCMATNTSSVACYAMNYTNFTIATNFGISGISEYKSAAAVPLVTSITLPDGSQYTFTYEATPGSCTPYPETSCVTGRMAVITLPTGGSITYQYVGGNNGIFNDGSTAGLNRATPDGSWSYARILSGTASATTVTAPKLPYDSAANQTILQFQGIYQTQRDVYQGAAPTISSLPITESTLQTANLLRETQLCYNGNTSSCNTTTITPPITQRNVTNILPGPNNLQSLTVYKYNSYGSLIEQDDYDYSGTLLKKTAVTYASLGNVTSFRQQITVTNTSGGTVSQTNYNYDQGIVQSTSGTPQHVSVSGSRGNLTSINYYTQGSGYLTKSMTYFDTGKVQTVTDVNNAQTTYTYGACGNSFPTSIAEPLTLSRSMTWNCMGGVETSVSDENSHVTSFSFTKDPYFWRPESATDPTNAITNFTYQGQTQSESALSFNSSATDVLDTLDNEGRQLLAQRRQVPSGSNFDSVETDYDAIGRPSRTTLPFTGTAGATNSSAPGKTTAYDALSRITAVKDSGGGTVTKTYSQNDVLITRGPAPSGENTKRRQLEYDALGRLTSVCEITNGPGGGSCGQIAGQTGYWTKYSYDALGRLGGVTQNAQSSSQTRSYSYDLLGRLISETNPESGTTTYVYDSTGACTGGYTSNGDLVQKVDANGVSTCYYYDSLHRLTDVGNGSYCKRFRYDNTTGVLGSIPPGVSVLNPMGRLAEAETDTCPPQITQASIITDEWFSYTNRGETSDIYESTPNSSEYYHVSETYWPNGTLNQLSGLAALPVITFTPDGEGRLYQVSASAGQNPVTNAAFNAASLATAVSYGSGDADSLTYDSNTNRLTQYEFSVNGQSLAGALTWNANHTLQTLNIADALNSTDTQSCSFGYDDLTRLSSANCGSAAAQTFSYDAFGNIDKVGSPFTFQPTYSVLTNRITGINGFTPTYDTDGNTITDPSHNYSWNAYGRPSAVDSTNLIYDAFDRMVEQNRSGTYTQIVYGPNGAKFALFTGTALKQAMVPLPGGGVAVYNSSGLLYYGHPDHLGSMRLGSTPSRTVYFDLAYAPFGETYSSSGSPDPSFTGQRQDTASSLYDFPAREYSTEGRWPSPDPLGLAAVHLSDPQTLNRYVYVRNNPLRLTDPTGLDGCDNSDISFARAFRRRAHAADDCNGDGGGGAGGGSGDPGSVGGDPGAGSGDPGSGGDPGNGGDPGSSGGDPTSGGDPASGGSNCASDDPLCLGNSGPNVPDPGQDPLGNSVSSDPGAACQIGTQWLCDLFSGNQVLKDNLQTDQSIFDMTSPFMDPFLMADTANGVILAEINQIESVNLLIDNVALGNLSLSALDNIPGLNVLPPGVGSAADAGISYFESMRNQNNQRIDQLLQQAAPPSPRP